ncbi:HIT domain-containing protein [Patescibacteria group bacterium]|nr:HIT domain-containing protein [Patescibacteria group bacterium]
MEKACDFCNKNNFATRIYLENKYFYWLLNRRPLKPGHTLIIPKKHCLALTDLTTEENSLLLNDLKKYLPQLLKVFKAVGYNLAINFSETAGQTVPHLHIHIVPRPQSDSTEKVDYVRAEFYRNTPEINRTLLTEQEINQQIKLLNQ